MNTRIFIPFLVFFIINSFSQSCIAEDNKDNLINSQSVFGNIGLIQTPSARFSPDGEFTFGISNESPYHRMYAKAQFYPWLEAVLRYTEGTHLPYFAGNTQTWKDKGLDLKVRLIEESTYIPQIALGLSDLGGTGAYSSEYIVASKRFDAIDFSIGMGWGRLGGLNHLDNPMNLFSDNRKVRGGSSDLGGTFNLGRFFTGNQVSIFGGLEYATPIKDLTLKLEYDTSNYYSIVGKEKKFDEVGNRFTVDSRLNIAMNYQLEMGTRDKIDFSFGLIRGNTIYAGMAIHSNLNSPAKSKFIAPPEILSNQNIEPFQALNDDWQKYLSETIMWQMGNVGFVTHELVFNENEIQAEISQGRFRDPVQAIDLASRILANNSPSNINRITVINLDQGIETLRASTMRSELERSVLYGPLEEEIISFNDYIPLASDAAIVKNDYLYPNFYWNIKPHMLGTLQHQSRFYFWQLEALIHTEYAIKKGLFLMADIGINILNNFGDYTYHVPDGQLHHVRQDRRLYLTEGESGLRNMSLQYIHDINPNLKALFQAGYLEWMYGGFGGEILYSPDSKRWGLGIDAYMVKQREFNQRFSFQDYETVTGFLSYYQDIPFYNSRLKISAGRFLGKDKGVHIDISRRFDSGARIGGIVALTDCDADCVGEGSFNKWIYFQLPMDLFYVESSTRNTAGYAWSPLTKDAGSKLESGQLYGLVMSATDEVKSLRTKSWSIKKIFSGLGTKPKDRI